MGIDVLAARGVLLVPARSWGRGQESIGAACGHEPRAQRLQRVFQIEIETCRHRGGAVKIIASIEDPVVIKSILDHLDRRDGVTDTSGKRTFKWSLLQTTNDPKWPRVCKKSG